MILTLGYSSSGLTSSVDSNVLIQPFVCDSSQVDLVNIYALKHIPELLKAHFATFVFIYNLEYLIYYLLIDLLFMILLETLDEFLFTELVVITSVYFFECFIQRLVTQGILVNR